MPPRSGGIPAKRRSRCQRLDLLPAGAVVADLTYRDTDLLLAAQTRGLKTVDGLPMLVHQGARAFELWTGSSRAGGDDAGGRPRARERGT